jgi:hypothetical protein
MRLWPSLLLATTPSRDFDVEARARYNCRRDRPDLVATWGPKMTDRRSAIEVVDAAPTPPRHASRERDGVRLPLPHHLPARGRQPGADRRRAGLGLRVSGADVGGAGRRHRRAAGVQLLHQRPALAPGPGAISRCDLSTGAVPEPAADVTTSRGLTCHGARRPRVTTGRGLKPTATIVVDQTRPRLP